MFSLQEPALFTRLKKAECVLVAGAGSGFDVYAGLPLALSLSATGRQVHLANLSFTALYGLDSDVWLDQDVASIGPETAGGHAYFPERTLARWLAARPAPFRTETILSRAPCRAGDPEVERRGTSADRTDERGGPRVADAA